MLFFALDGVVKHHFIFHFFIPFHKKNPLMSVQLLIISQENGMGQSTVERRWRPRGED
jgi:hypothetical protein